ncbi:MAG: hypothetical protein ACREI9_09185 [Nitrospiraceae bacterium]
MPSLAIILNAVVEGRIGSPARPSGPVENFGVDGLQNAADRRLARRRAAKTQQDTHRTSQMRTAGVRSHSAIAVNVRAPASIAQTPIARTATNLCRTPRRDLGPSTKTNTASRSTGTGSELANACPGQVAATEIGKDGQADTAAAPVIVLA